jgi:hypothetical protein
VSFQITINRTASEQMGKNRKKGQQTRTAMVQMKIEVTVCYGTFLSWVNGNDFKVSRDYALVCT